MPVNRKLGRAKKIENHIIDVVGNKLFLLVEEQLTNKIDALRTDDVKEKLFIKWYPEKNGFLKELIADFNLLKKSRYTVCGFSTN